MRDVRRWLRAVAVLAFVAVLAAACRVQTEDVARPTAASPAPTGTDTEATALPILGPTITTHWHAAYIVRICDRVLEPFESEADPLGIHSHADGLIHIHPFFDEAGYDNARLQLFGDAMGFELSTGELRLPDGGTWRDGDLCGDRPGRVFVDRWAGPGSGGQPERIFADPDQIRFEADREIFQIAFAPEDSPPVVPPSEALLEQVSAPFVDLEPWIEVAADADRSSVRVWPIAATTDAPCAGEQREVVGQLLCVLPDGPPYRPDEAFESARAVVFNREPAVDVELGSRIRADLAASLLGLADGGSDFLAYAVEVEGVIVTVVRTVVGPPDQNRFVLVGGFSTDSAIALAALLD